MKEIPARWSFSSVFPTIRINDGTEVKDVHKIANDEKVVPREWVTEDGSYVTDDFVSYVRPLIQGDVSPVMVDGIPRHLYRKN